MEDKLYLGVIGASSCDDITYQHAEKVGALIAESGAVLVCGGRGGVMEAACKGAKKKNGTTVGILPDADAINMNPFLDYRILTGFGEARNMIIVRTIDAAVAISGSYGTLSEIAFCLKTDVPVISLNSWDIPGIVLKTDNPEKAVETAIRRAKRSYE
ncbi:MAG: TIGR00725 family protein [candidate division Zixibacteria bacterium]|nr:TIGR00725 family protein [candidate division Zixibacteria bacterium]